ncbi:MAG: F0F1 ATP synthase subunit delta [Burkholderiaceae bacterium]|nr:F0F1 ATP synthase subunit delta [Burkholderiaceae bacterium]
MAELATLARPYAEALFDVASQGDVGAISQQVDALAAIADNAQLREFANSPKVSSEQVFDLISSVVSTPLSEPMKNLLRTVIDNGRLTVLPEIALQFHALANAGAGVSDATVFSAFPIEATQLSDLVATLEKRFARKLNVAVQLEPALIGGIRVVVGDEVMDTSVKARLEQMRVALTA